MDARYFSGFVYVDTLDGGRYQFMADRADPPGSLRKLAEEHRERAARLLRHAALMEDAADRLT